MAGITYPNIPYGDTTYVDKINTNLSEIDTQLENIVKDPTKALYGLSASAVPDDIFGTIKSLLDSKAKLEFGSYVGNGANSKSLTFSSSPKFVFVVSGSSIATGGGGIYAIGLWFRGMERLTSFQTSPVNDDRLCSVSSNTITWSSVNADKALNTASGAYCYAAIL